MNDKFTEILKRAEKEISEGKFDLAGLKTAERTGELALGANEYFGRLLEDDCFRMFVVGSTNSGKSAFVNSLIGKNLMPVSSNSCTAIAYRIERSDDRSVSFPASRAGTVTLTEEGEFGFDEESDLTDALSEFVGKESVKGEKSDFLRRAIAFINDLPKTEEEAGACGWNDYISGKEITVKYPVRLELPVGSFVINDTPGHTDSANGGSHFGKLCDAIRGDTANTVLLFVLRPDNPSTTDNAELVDKICEINKAIDPSYSFFIVSHADAVAQNPISLSDGKTLTQAERLAEFDNLIEKNTVMAKSCVVEFKNRNVFFVDSYKSLLAFGYPELLSEDGFLPYEHERDDKGNLVVSDRVLPYYRKDRTGTEGVSAEEIRRECEEILQSGSSSLEKALVRSGLRSVGCALSRYILLKKDELKADKLRRGIEGRFAEVEERLKKEKSEAISRLNALYAEKEETEERLGRVVKDKLDAVRFSFDRSFFAELEEEVGKHCFEVMKDAVSDFHGIDKEQFAKLYGSCHPKTNLVSLKGMNRRSMDVFKEEVKTEIVEKQLNDLYYETVIEGFFDNEKFGKAVKAQKSKILGECYRKLAGDDRLEGIADPAVEVTEDLKGDVRGFAVKNLREREVSLRWNDFTGGEKLKNFFVGIFRPSKKKLITQKLEVDEEAQSDALSADWKTIEEALENAVEQSFSENELAAFRKEASGKECLSSVKSMREIVKAIADDEELLDAITLDEETMKKKTEDFRSLFAAAERGE